MGTPLASYLRTIAARQTCWYVGYSARHLPFCQLGSGWSTAEAAGHGWQGVDALTELFRAGGVRTQLVFVSACHSESAGKSFAEAGVRKFIHHDLIVMTQIGRERGGLEGGSPA